MIPASGPPAQARPKPTDVPTLFPDRAMLTFRKRLGRLFRAGTCGAEAQFRRTRSWRAAGRAAFR